MRVWVSWSCYSANYSDHSELFLVPSDLPGTAPCIPTRKALLGELVFPSHQWGPEALGHNPDKTRTKTRTKAGLAVLTTSCTSSLWEQQGQELNF